MKKISIITFFILAICGFCFAQSKLPEFEKAKEIRLLKSTREDVKKIFAGYEHDEEDDEDQEQSFSTENAEIEVSFSTGNCSDEDSEEYWNVPEWTVTKIEITPEDTLKLDDFKFDFSSFTKEIKNEEFSESFSYHNENAGIIFKIDEGEILNIVFYPPKNNIAYLCTNEKTSEIISGEKRLVDSILEDQIVCKLKNGFANITELNLNSAEVLIGCWSGEKNKSCEVRKTKVSVSTTAIDPENDVLTYNYEISAGKIIGQGKEVIWDLTSVPPGTHTVTAWADDGCGRCGQEITKTVVVKECPDCSKNQKNKSEKP